MKRKISFSNRDVFDDKQHFDMVAIAVSHLVEGTSVVEVSHQRLEIGIVG